MSDEQHPNSNPLEEAISQAFSDPAPQDLRAVLLEQAQRVDRMDREDRPHPWVQRHWMLATASFLLAISLGSFLHFHGATAVNARLAKAAMNDFAKAQTLDFEGQPQVALNGAPDSCCAWSQSRLGFTAPLPSLAVGCPLKGGRACVIEGRSAASYVLEDGRCIVVMETPIRGAGDSPGSVLASVSGFQARAWNEKGRGILLIERNPPKEKQVS